MNQDQQKQTEAEAHQQGHPDGDEVDCLHCALGKAWSDWHDRQTEGSEAGVAGYSLGQFLAEAISEAISNMDGSPELKTEFMTHFIMGQQAVSEVEVVDATAGSDTKH